VTDELDGDRDPLLRSAIEALRAPVGIGDRAIAGALEQLARPTPTRHSRALGWSVAAAALLAAAVALHGIGRRAGAEPVHFALRAPAAGEVSVIGDFNGWDAGANPLRRHDGEWSVTLRLKPGRYRYSFLLDGKRWLADPDGQVADDEFGTPTSVITIAERARS
jgi:Glycogen recognition site of AMP-activated protein kinase